MKGLNSLYQKVSKTSIVFAPPMVLMFAIGERKEIESEGKELGSI